MKYISSPVLSAMRKSQWRCTEVSINFQQTSAFIWCIKQVFDVYFRTPEFHQAGTEKKTNNCIKVKLLLNYSCRNWTFLCFQEDEKETLRRKRSIECINVICSHSYSAPFLIFLRQSWRNDSTDSQLR